MYIFYHAAIPFILLPLNAKPFSYRMKYKIYCAAQTIFHYLFAISLMLASFYINSNKPPFRVVFPLFLQNMSHHSAHHSRMLLFRLKKKQLFFNHQIIHVLITWLKQFTGQYHPVYITFDIARQWRPYILPNFSNNCHVIKGITSSYQHCY